MDVGHVILAVVSIILLSIYIDKDREYNRMFNSNLETLRLLLKTELNILELIKIVRSIAHITSLSAETRLEILEGVERIVRR